MNKSSKYILFGIFLFLFALILKPFLTSITFAALFAVIAHSLHTRLSKKISKDFSALLIVIATIIVILLPLGLFVGLVAREALSFAAGFDTQSIFNFFKPYQDLKILGYSLDTASLASNLQQWLSTAGNTIYRVAMDAGSSIMNFGFLFFVFLFLYYYFLKDGDQIVEKIKKLLPFESSQNTELIKQCKTTARTVFAGNLLSAIVGGLIAFTGFYLFQVPGALIWAILATILSLIPTIGVFFVYLAASLTTIPSGEYTLMLGLMIYFIVMEIVVRENFIKPKLLDNKLAMHPILLFFALVGGIQAFGSTGMLYGPVIVICFVSILNFMTKK